ncbi:MAG: hypothetical protein RIQ56_484, partial [Candidatus Parcubacteria bacterium]
MSYTSRNLSLLFALIFSAFLLFFAIPSQAIADEITDPQHAIADYAGPNVLIADDASSWLPFRRDRRAPHVQVISPSNGETVSGATAIDIFATDNVGVAGVTVFVDGNPIGSELQIPPYSLIWNTTTYPDGEHSIEARARDAAGNQRTTYITVIVDNFISPPPSSSNLIRNPSFDNGTLFWNTGSWGTNSPIFSFPVEGSDATPGAAVRLTNFSSGDAKWFFDDVAV